MDEQAREYRTMLRRLVNLQQQLIQVFEKEVEVLPPQPDFASGFGDELADVIRPELPISEILRAWPANVDTVPLVAWVKPRKGVVQFQGRDWLFDIHGCAQVSFVGLPSKLQGGGPNVAVEYLEGGRTDGISGWSVLLFTGGAGLVRPKAGDLSESDHQRLLEELVREGFLVPGPRPLVGRTRYFVLAEPNQQPACNRGELARDE